METDYNELFHGKDIADRAKKFEAELQAINEKYIEFFKERPSHLSSQEHDRVENHCMTFTSNGVVRFNFTDNVLPENIQQDCIDAFMRVYEGAKKT